VSESRLDLVRRAITAFNERDVEGMRALGGDDFEYDWTRSIGLNRGVYRGEEGFLDFIDDQWATFSEVRVEVRELLPLGDHVLATMTTHGRGREGVAVRANSFQLFSFEGDRLVRLTLFQDRDEAIEAARAR
jgi:ketosteroid isomerase-like protein